MKTELENLYTISILETSKIWKDEDGEGWNTECVEETREEIEENLTAHEALSFLQKRGDFRDEESELLTLESIEASKVLGAAFYANFESTQNNAVESSAAFACVKVQS